MGQRIEAALDAQQLHHAARAVHDAVEPLSRDLRQRADDSRAGDLRHHRRRADALLLQHVAREDVAAPWWAWFAAAVAIWAAFWIATAASPGMRPALGLADLAPVQAAAAGAAKAPADVVAVVQTRCSMCHSPEPAWEGIGEAPKGVLLDTPEHIARSRRDPHAGGADPRDAAQQPHRNDAGGARGARALARRREIGAKLKDLGQEAAEMTLDTAGAARRLMARLDEFAAIHRRAGPADAALSLAVLSRAPANASPSGCASRPRAGDRRGRQCPRAL